MEIANEFGYVALVIVAYCFLNFWMTGQVIEARKKYKVAYPALYASESENKDAKLFNCYQRGHQNSLEMMPMFFVLMGIAGIRHPYLTAGLGCFYIFARLFYFKGYATGVPDNRVRFGRFGFMALFGLLGCSISSAIALLRA